MSIFKTKYFNKWQSKESELDDNSLIKAIEELDRGLFEANLGGGLFKKRVAMPGKGKSGGYRVIIAHKSKDQSWIFLYGFSKSEISNINSDDLSDLKELANDLFSISMAKLAKVLIEVKNEK
jgi:hypothetical protein